MGTVGVIIGLLIIAASVLFAVKFLKDNKNSTNDRPSKGGGGTGGGSTTPQENKK
jgi:hypothetical protein